MKALTLEILKPYLNGKVVVVRYQDVRHGWHVGISQSITPSLDGSRVVVLFVVPVWDIRIMTEPHEDESRWDMPKAWSPVQKTCNINPSLVFTHPQVTLVEPTLVCVCEQGKSLELSLETVHERFATSMKERSFAEQKQPKYHHE